MFRGSPRPRETVWSHQRGEAESGGQSPPPPIPTRAAPSAPSQLRLLHPTWEGPLPLGVVLRRQRAPGQGRCPTRATQGSEEPLSGPGQSHNRSPPRKGAANSITESHAGSHSQTCALPLQHFLSHQTAWGRGGGGGGDGERGSAGSLRTSQKAPQSGVLVEPAPP